MATPGFVQIQCPICENVNDTEIFPARLFPDTFSPYAFSARRARRREHYRIVRCNGCGLVRSNPILDPTQIQSLYEDSLFCYDSEVDFAADTYVDLFLNLLSGRCRTGEMESILEIGCGNGFFLERAQQMGIPRVLGFEPSSECLLRASPSIRPHIINGVFRPELVQGQRFDVICSFHVIDHLVNPRQTLNLLTRYMNVGGFMLLVCHDVEAWSARFLRTHSPIFDVEHICLFSRDTLSLLVQRSGLRPLEVGLLTNRYPLGYWLRMAPLGNFFSRLLPKGVKERPVALRAGNLYMLAQRQE